MNRRTVLRFPVFNDYEVRVIVAHDVAATGRRLGADLSHAEAALIKNKGRSMHSWLVLKADADEATVAHEASHAIRAMLTAVGVRNDDEVFAYHLAHLVEQLHKFLKTGQSGLKMARQAKKASKGER